MRARRHGLRALVCGLFLALTCAGCAGLSERVVGWYVTRRIDGYLDFDSAQKRAARARVDETLERLRREELSRWVSFFREVRQGFQAGLDEDGIARLQRHYDARLDAGVAMLAPAFAEMLADLRPEQLDHFAKRMRADVDEHYRERDLPDDERLAAIEERAVEVTEDFVGDLDDTQLSELRAIIRGLPDERPVQYRAAHAQITRFRAFMAERPAAPRIAEELVTMWEHRYDALGPGREKPVRRLEQRRALSAVFGLLNAEQRAHAADELSERIRELKRFVL